MVTAGELVAMQAVQQATLIESCTIVRHTMASDGAGGQTVSESTTSSICRLAASNSVPADRLVAGGVQEQVLWRITLPTGTDVRRQDAIRIGSRTFEVMGIYGPHTHTTALVCVCVER
jgi:head-tail adaptor